MNIIKSTDTLSNFLLRSVVAVIIATHGWHRALSGGYEPFGDWLTSQGFPFGLALAILVTGIEILGSIALLFGMHLVYLCGVYVLIYLTGLVLVHWQNGWFVVGSGTNGIEYSVLIIASLICIALSDVKRKDNPELV